MWLAREQTGYCNDSSKTNSPRARFPQQLKRDGSPAMPNFYQNDFLQRMSMDRLCGRMNSKGQCYAGNGKWAGVANDDVWSTIQQWR